MSDLKIGDTAPDFLIKISENKEYSLKELNG